MLIVNIRDAKTHFSRLVKIAGGGETVIIAKAGKPIAKLVGIDTISARPSRRIGFMAGQFIVPDTFDTMGATKIEHLFGIDPG